MLDPAREAGSPTGPDAPDSNFVFDARYSNYALGILFLVYVFNFIDRQILSILVEPIKEDLGATDTQMGLSLIHI